MRNLNKKLVKEKYDEAFNIAIAEIERLARDILHKHRSLDKFTMAMGVWFFTYKVGVSDGRGGKTTENNHICYDPLGYMKPLEDFIDKWDEYLHLTGEPMCFTATGPVVRNW